MCEQVQAPTHTCGHTPTHLVQLSEQVVQRPQPASQVEGFAQLAEPTRQIVESDMWLSPKISDFEVEPHGLSTICVAKPLKTPLRGSALALAL